MGTPRAAPQAGRQAGSPCASAAPRTAGACAPARRLAGPKVPACRQAQGAARMVHAGAASTPPTNQTRWSQVRTREQFIQGPCQHPCSLLRLQAPQLAAGRGRRLRQAAHPAERVWTRQWRLGSSSSSSRHTDRYELASRDCQFAVPPPCGSSNSGRPGKGASWPQGSKPQAGGSSPVVLERT